jgi:hypothetical protein
MTMHSAIVAVEFPTQGGPSTQREGWQAFLASIAKLEGNEAVARLGENVWQIDFQLYPGGLGTLIAACEQHDFRYGILPLADAPEWLPAEFDPGTIWRP